MRLPGEDKFVRNRTLVIACSAAVLIASWFYAPYVNHGPVVCPLHGVMGLPCPACGLTHAFCELAHGQMAEAAAHNAIAFPLAGLFLAALIVAPVELVLRRRLSFYRWLYSTRVAWVVGGMLIVYHLGRTAVFCLDGRLFTDYVATSWTYGLIHHFFG